MSGPQGARKRPASFAQMGWRSSQTLRFRAAAVSRAGRSSAPPRRSTLLCAHKPKGARRFAVRRAPLLTPSIPWFLSSPPLRLPLSPRLHPHHRLHPLPNVLVLRLTIRCADARLWDNPITEEQSMFPRKTAWSAHLGIPILSNRSWGGFLSSTYFLTQALTQTTAAIQVTCEREQHVSLLLSAKTATTSTTATYHIVIRAPACRPAGSPTSRLALARASARPRVVVWVLQTKKTASVGI